MAEFTLDTSGIVPACAPTADPNILGPCGFHDLSPFVQGYVEALWHDLPTYSERNPDPRFSDLSPEALALILRDCDEAISAPHLNLGARYNNNDAGGRCFWADRQAGIYRNFGPLTPYLCDDGKVQLKETNA